MRAARPVTSPTSAQKVLVQENFAQLPPVVRCDSCGTAATDHIAAYTYRWHVAHDGCPQILCPACAASVGQLAVVWVNRAAVNSHEVHAYCASAMYLERHHVSL